MSNNYLTSPGILKEFPRFMMCRFSQPAKPVIQKYSEYSEYLGYQEALSDDTVQYFEIEILRVDNSGKNIIFKSNDPDVIIDRYKDVYGNICMNWDTSILQYISPGVSYTLPWSYVILTDNIILLPEKKVSTASRIKNLFSKKIR